MLKPTAERSALALQHYESIRTSAIEVFCNKSAFGHDMRAHRAPTRQISVLVAAAMFTKAALWAGWVGRDRLHDALAVVHHLTCLSMTTNDLERESFVISSRPVSGLPQMVPAQTQVDCVVSGGASDHVRHRLTTATVERIDAVLSERAEAGGALLVQCDEQRIVPLVAERRPRAGTVLTYHEMCNLFGLPVSSEAPLRRLLLHRPFDNSHAHDASLLTPLLETKGVEKHVDLDSLQQQELAHMHAVLSDVAVTGVVMADICAKADSKKTSLIQPHSSLPEASFLRLFLSVEAHREVSAVYINGTFAVAQRELEERHRNVLTIIDEMDDGLADGGPLPSARQPKSAAVLELEREMAELRRRFQQAEQLRSQAIGLRMRGEDAMLVSEVQVRARHALMDVLALRIQLEANPLVRTKATRQFFRAECELAGLDAISSDALWARLRELAKSSRAGMAHLVQIINERPKLELSPNLRHQVQLFQRCGQSAPTALAYEKATRATAGRPADATYSVGAQPLAHRVGDMAGRYDGSLVGRHVEVNRGLIQSTSRTKDLPLWISAVVHGFQPEWQGRAAYYTLDFAPLRIARLKVALPHPTKQVLFLPAVSAAIESDSLPPMPPLPNEPAAVWANIQRRTSAVARQGMAGLLLAALLPHPPPTESLSEDDLALVAEAHAAPGRQRDGLVKIWADHVPLTRDTFARLRPVPAHTQYEGARYHLNDEAVNSFLGLINRAGNGSHAFIFSSHLFTALEACADPTIDDTVTRYLKGCPSAVELLAREQLFFVVNIPATDATVGHWYLMGSNREDQHIFAIDSCGAARPNAILVVQRFLELLHAKAAMPGTLPTRFTAGWRSGSLVHRTPQQPDAVSCGVFMLVTLWCLVCGVDLHSRLELLDSVNYWRRRVTLCLYCGSLSSV
jgi:hypothetical protein